MSYSLDLTAAQDDVKAQIESLGYALIEGANPDGYPSPNGSYSTGKIKEFLVINFGNLRRQRRGRSLTDYKLDSHESGFDLFAVAHDAKTARKLINAANDALIGYKPTGSGGLHMGDALFEGVREVVDTQNRPTRVLATSRFRFVPFAQKVAP